MLRAAVEVIGTIIVLGGAAWFAQPVVQAFRKRQKSYDNDLEKGQQ